MTASRIVIGRAWTGDLLARFADAFEGCEVVAGANLDPSKAKDADVLVPFTMKVDRVFLEANRPKLIQQFGVGVDQIDLAAARDLGIPVANAPADVSRMAGSVAEGAILLLLSCARLPSIRAENLATGRWSWTIPLNKALAGRRVGLVGMGSIGRATARRLVPFEMDLVGVRRTPAEEPGMAWVGGMDRLDELLETSDFVIVSTPLTPETQGLIGAAQLARMKPTASLINVGRGALVDEEALKEALDAGRLHSAGLDTVCVEPLPQDSWMLHHDRVVLTPHDAGVSDQVFDKLTSMVRDALGRHAKGQPLDFLLN